MSMTVTPFLMFEGSAEEAMELYVSLIPGSGVDSVERHPPGTPGSESLIKLAAFHLGDLAVLCNDSPVKHAFGFTPSSSLFVRCPSEEALDRLVGALGDGGELLMPPGDYGFSPRFAWLNDRFGVSWQLNLDPAPKDL